MLYHAKLLDNAFSILVLLKSIIKDLQLLIIHAEAEGKQNEPH